MKAAAKVDAERRQDIRRNHTTAHLLHYALRQVLGDKAEQKGSFVGPDRLRFDFQHASALTTEEKAQIEEIINRRILENARVVTRVMPVDEARKSGAIALFGEKYGDMVRVISTGDFSTELCGGTHMDATGPIGSFRLTAEDAVAAGVRRIEGVTGLAAFRLSSRQGELLGEISRELKTPAQEARERIRTMGEQLRNLEKSLSGLKVDHARQRLAGVQAVACKDIKLTAADVGDIGGKELAELALSALAERGDDAVLVLAGRDGDKAALVVAVSKRLAPARIKAGDVVKRLAAMIGGGGGGKPDFAQAGGKEPGKLPEMLAAAPTVVAELLK